MLQIKTIGKTTEGEPIFACANRMWLGPAPDTKKLVVSIRGSDSPKAHPRMRPVRVSIRGRSGVWNWITKEEAKPILQNFGIVDPLALLKKLRVIPGARQAVYQQIRRALRICKQCGAEPIVKSGMGLNCLAIAREAKRKKFGCGKRRKWAVSYTPAVVETRKPAVR